MSDRTSAEIFGMMFGHLADEPQDERARSLAKKLWNEIGNYDFSNYQMDADKALIKLGLAKTGFDPRHPEEGEIILYLRSDGSFR